MPVTPSVVIAGAGVLGAALAQRLARRDWAVTLVEPARPGHVRAASGAATRWMRCSAGPDEETTRSAWRAHELWREVGEELGVPLLEEVGCVLFARGDGAWEAAGEEVLRARDIPVERLDRRAAARMFPDVDLRDCGFVLHEPRGGLVRAARAVDLLVADAVAHGTRLVAASAAPAPDGSVVVNGETVSPDHVVWACGAWASGLLPALGPARTVQHDTVLFGVDAAWSTPGTPVWLDHAAGISGAGDVEGRGLRIGVAWDGPVLDPGGSTRTPDPEQLARARSALATRFPALADAPHVGTECCHSTSVAVALPAAAEVGGARVVRLPGPGRRWAVGDGAGSVFKHAPAVAEATEELMRAATG